MIECRKTDQTINAKNAFNGLGRAASMVALALSGQSYAPAYLAA